MGDVIHIKKWRDEKNQNGINDNIKRIQQSIKNIQRVLNESYDSGTLSDDAKDGQPDINEQPVDSASGAKK